MLEDCADKVIIGLVLLSRVGWRCRLSFESRGFSFTLKIKKKKAR